MPNEEGIALTGARAESDRSKPNVYRVRSVDAMRSSLAPEKGENPLTAGE